MYDFNHRKRRCIFQNLIFCFLLICLFASLVICFSDNADETSDNYIWKSVGGNYNINSTWAVKNAYHKAKGLASQMLCNQINSFHLVFALLEEDNSIASILVKSKSGDTNKLRNILSDLILKEKDTFSFDPFGSFTSIDSSSNFGFNLGNIFKLNVLAPSKDLIQLHLTAIKICLKNNSKYLRVDHLISALASDTRMFKIFDAAGVALSSIIEEVESRTDFLDDTSLNVLFLRYGQDLTALARKKQLFPVFNRDKEIGHLVQSLLLAEKNNVLLLGEPGVGKTAIVEALAMKIVDKDVPDILKNKSVVSIDIATLIAGTSFRGDLESRILKLFEVAKKSDDIIFFIDEIHNLSSRTSDGSMNTADMIKNIIDGGKIRLIGATTTKEYARFIRKDPAFSRRFRKIMIEEPSIESSISILRGLKSSYEAYHGIRILDEAIVASVELSRHMHNRRLPDKAIDVLDMAIASKRLELSTSPEEVDELDKNIIMKKTELSLLQNENDRYATEKKKNIESEIANLEEKLKPLKIRFEAEKAQMDKVRHAQKALSMCYDNIEKLKKRNNTEAITFLTENVIPRIKNVLKEIDEQSKFTKDERMISDVVGYAEIAVIVSKMTGIPVSKVTEDEKIKFLHLAQNIKKKIIGQDSAVDAISNSIINSRFGLTFGKRPVGTFLLLGPTGVGKTELARTIAEETTSSNKRLIIIDGTELMTQESIMRLIGSSPGYIGYGDGGQLTEALRKHPNSVVLFDELEKAHASLFNLLLQVFGDARITDGEGNSIDCSNAVFIMTSNLGSNVFNSLFKEENFTEKMKEVEEEVLNIARQTFPPEFYNRIDKVEVFLPLDRNNQKRILKLLVSYFSERLEKLKGSKVSLDDDALDIVLEACFNLSYGARPLARYVDYTLGVEFSKLALQKNGLPEHAYIYIMKYDEELEKQLIEKKKTSKQHSIQKTCVTDDLDYNLNNIGDKCYEKNGMDLYDGEDYSNIYSCENDVHYPYSDEYSFKEIFANDAPIIGKLLLVIFDKNDDGEPNMERVFYLHSFFIHQSDDIRFSKS